MNTHIMQFAHGLLVQASDVSVKLSDPLPSFNPPADELPDNPFAGMKEAAQQELLDSASSAASLAAELAAEEALATQKAIDDAAAEALVAQKVIDDAATQKAIDDAAAQKAIDDKKAADDAAKVTK